MYQYLKGEGINCCCVSSGYAFHSNAFHNTCALTLWSGGAQCFFSVWGAQSWIHLFLPRQQTIKIHLLVTFAPCAPRSSLTTLTDHIVLFFLSIGSFASCLPNMNVLVFPSSFYGEQFFCHTFQSFFPDHLMSPYHRNLSRSPTLSRCPFVFQSPLLQQAACWLIHTPTAPVTSLTTKSFLLGQSRDWKIQQSIS